MTGSWNGRGNQYIEFIRVLYCKLPTNGKQLPAFPLEAMTWIEPRPQRWEARVLPNVVQNVWFQAALMDVSIKYVHGLGSLNQIAYLLSRWTNSVENSNKLYKLIESPVKLNMSLHIYAVC